MVAKHPDMIVVAVVDDAAELSELAAETVIDIVLADWPSLVPLAAGGTDDHLIDRPAKLEQPLTPREIEVLAALADGATNKVIARRLGISFHTVKFHIASILDKLDADSRTEAVTKAARLGLVML